MFKRRRFRTAKGLWESLSPTDDLFGDGHERELMFRGQPDARMKLIPSALRDDNPARMLWRGSPSCDQQVFLEIYALKAFATYADKAGIRLPNDSMQFRHILSGSQHYMSSPYSWPGDEFFAIMTLAQHYGVKTRLLDWTRNPYMAIYFAASSALLSFKEWRRNDSKLAIWVKDPQVRHKDVRIIPTVSVTERSAAQQGLFTVHQSSGKKGEPLTILGLDEMPEFHTGLIQLSAPVQESIKLLDLCERVGINAATIYTGAEGVGKATLEHFHRYIAEEYRKEQ